MTKKNIFESYMKNINAMEGVIKKKTEEIKQLHGQLRSARENLIGSVECYMMEELGLIGYEEEVVRMYRAATADADKKVREANKNANELVLCVDVLEAEIGSIMEAEFYGANTVLGKACFILLTDDISDYEHDGVHHRNWDMYYTVRNCMLDCVSKSRTIGQEVKDKLLK